MACKVVGVSLATVYRYLTDGSPAFRVKFEALLQPNVRMLRGRHSIETS